MQRFKKHLIENDIIKVIVIPSFFLLMISEFFSQIAFNMQHFVLIFIIYEITHSNTAVSGIILTFTIPAILFSLLAGVYVDRWNKKKVMFITNLLRGLFLLPFLIPNTNPIIIYSLTFFIAVTTQFFLPAESSIIPELIPKKLLIAGNAVFSAGIFTTVFLGYILSGPTLLLLGKSGTFIFLAVLFFISAACILLIKDNQKQEKIAISKALAVGSSVKRDIKEIFAFINKTKEVRTAIFVLTASQSVVFTFGVLGPGYLATNMHLPVESLSWILLAPAAIGMVIGGGFLGSFSKNFNNTIMNTLGFFIIGIVFFFLPFCKTPHLLVVLALIAGLGDSLIFVPANAVIQANTHEKIRGRIYGFLNALTGSVSLLPVVVAGGLADIFGVGQVIFSIGIILVIVAVTRFTIK